MWVCPTFQRPERLAELALSWEKHEPGTPLAVRVWDKDPRREDYFNTEWPESWELYVSDKKGAGETLNEYYRMNPNEETYGFIGDDIILRTPWGLKILEDAAKPWFLAYPNDTIQRHRLCTHFCLGGEFVRCLSTVVPPMLKHTYMDVGLIRLAQPLALLRFCPQVIFQHKHFIDPRYGIEKDATYLEIYPNDSLEPAGPMEDEGKAGLKLYEKVYWEKAIDRLILGIYQGYEHWEQWEAEDESLYRRSA